jgi:hypothetical protein
MHGSVHSISNGYFGYARYSQGGTDQTGWRAGSAAIVRRFGPVVSFDVLNLVVELAEWAFSMLIAAIPQRSVVIEHRAAIAHIKPTATGFAFPAMLTLAQRRTLKIKRDTEQNCTDICGSPC